MPLRFQIDFNHKSRINKGTRFLSKMFLTNSDVIKKYSDVIYHTDGSFSEGVLNLVAHCLILKFKTL